MALPSSGQISVSDILTEGGQSSTRANTSLSDLELGNVFTINTASTLYPNGSAPHLISEWYGYDHTAASSLYYWDLSNDIKWNQSDVNATYTQPLATSATDLSISLWIRPQWAATDLNLILVDLTDSSANSNNNRFFIQYDYGLNRFIARYRSNSVNFDRQWALHQNNTQTGTGTNSTDRWTSSNRGNTNTDGFVHLVLTYDGSQSTAGNAFKLYWNGSELSNQAATNSNTRTNVSLDEITFCGNEINANGSRISDFMYMHMWEAVVSSTSVGTMYNSGTPISAADASQSTYLIFGDTSTSVPNTNPLNDDIGDLDDASNFEFQAANGQTVVQL
jgi:hypothetical protein